MDMLNVYVNNEKVCIEFDHPFPDRDADHLASKVLYEVLSERLDMLENEFEVRINDVFAHIEDAKMSVHSYEDVNGNTLCMDCRGKVEGGYCNCHLPKQLKER